MLMYPHNPPSQLHFHTPPPPSRLSLSNQSAVECMPQVCAKLQSFHVEIRSRSLRQYKERIRNEFMSTAIIEELLQRKPMDSESAREWARELGKEYGKTEKYVLCMDKAVEVFKLVEKFPSKETLQLLEVVTLRADRETINELFQYDVMRLLHRFTNIDEGNGEAGRVGVGVGMQEVEMMREVVITESLCPSPSRLQRVQLARGAVRVIAGLCGKAQHIRNFAILNHKTFVYCLRCLNAFGDSLQLEFSMFLEAATHQPFARRGEEQYKRITNKIIKSFFAQQDIRIELESPHNPSLTAIQHLINALKNLIKMGDPETLARILAARTAHQLGVAEQLTYLVSRCAYVMNFPAVEDSRQELTPICIVFSTIQLMLQLDEQMQKLSIPNNNYNPTPLFREIYRFVSLRTLPLAHRTTIDLRRALYFLTYNRLCDQLQQDLLDMVYFSQDEQENLISLFAYFMQVEVDNSNVCELAATINNLFIKAEPHLIEPLLLPSGILGAMMQRMLNCDYQRNEQLSTVEDTVNTMLLTAIETILAVFGQKIGSRVGVYKQIVMDYAERLYCKYEAPGCPKEMGDKARNILSMCQNRQGQEQM